jgi:hypothetical protein
MRRALSQRTSAAAGAGSEPAANSAMLALFASSQARK